MAAQPPEGHRPSFGRLADGRFVIRCDQCERQRDGSVPVGIGVPITGQFEAEAIFRNHGGRAG
jgi:hypothetical protein